MATKVSITIGLGNSWLSDRTKPLLKAIDFSLIRFWVFTREQYQSESPSYYPVWWVWKSYFRNYGHISQESHYNDVIMGAIASQITSLTIVYSTVYSDADQRKHQSSASLACVWGIHRWPVNSPHKWPVKREMFPFDDVIMNGLMLSCGLASSNLSNILQAHFTGTGLNAINASGAALKV